ncbi:MAG: zinc metallopeptidase [Candidatus Eisenbacteria bacterium]|nr:zinc metallopeptidase [Candidatus Eisenbacteria bacterium]
MRWKGREQSGNVDDRRGARPGGLIVGGGLGTVVLVVAFLLLGGDPRQLLQLAGQSQVTTGAPASPGAPANAPDEGREFVAVVLKDTEDVWGDLFRQAGRTYEPPTLVLFRDQVESGCGVAGSSTGPFYCPADRRVYVDLAFYDELRDRFGAPGDFAQAYVVAHEVGHHVQNLLGISERVAGARGRVSQEEFNRLSVRLELQADFFAGVWAHHAERAKQILEAGDLEEALNAASAIGDDRLQRQATGTVTPDSFTHGTSAQRARWFRKGFETGDLSQGDTFSAATL